MFPPHSQDDGEEDLKEKSKEKKHWLNYREFNKWIKKTLKIQKVMQMYLQTTSFQQTDCNLSLNNGYFGKAASLSSFINEHDIIWYGRPLRYVWVHCSVPSLLKLWLMHSLLPGVGCRVTNREDLDAAQPTFSNN